MARELETECGKVVVAEQTELFARAVGLAADELARSTSRHFLWALTGGSTPKAWYRWCVQAQALPVTLRSAAHFTVSDERHVPLGHEDSNFGTAARLLLGPLEIATERRHPWVVAYPPAEAAEAYRRTWNVLAGPGRAYDVCFLGLGDDAHTASLFPGSPLLADDRGLLFDAVEVPGKGWRFTVTPSGLRACRRIVVMALGAAKASALRRVLRGKSAIAAVPARVLAECADRVTWLIDEAAAAELGG
jgi:6-phosphogluconolactonase